MLSVPTFLVGNIVIEKSFNDLKFWSDFKVTYITAKLTLSVNMHLEKIQGTLLDFLTRVCRPRHQKSTQS